MIAYIWPMALVIFSNVFYQISSKSTPGDINPLASLTVTYCIGMVVSGVLYFLTNRDGNLLQEYGKLNWAPFVLGLTVVGLEFGWICAYKAGWKISTGFITQSAILSSLLVAVGYGLYQESISWNKIAGVIICLVGLGFLNRK